MTPQEQEAYNLALASIEVCLESGEESLDLAGMGLTKIPPEIGRLTGLKELDLESNELTSLPSEIGKLTTLKELYLANNQLTSLPPEIVELSALVVIDLEENKLTRLPSEIAQLTALRKLNLSRNQLRSLPPEIGSFAALTGLGLDGNELTSLPSEIGRLTALTGLYLSGNQLSNLPPEIGRLTALTELHLNHNKLTNLPNELKSLSALWKLETEGNQLGKLSNNMRLWLKKFEEGRGEEVIAAAAFGTQEVFRARARPDEGQLNAKKYAEVLAAMFRREDAYEFALALLGHWGRGKTYLMEMVRDELQNPGGGTEAPANVKTIVFSAWRYPTRPEVWVHFYETLLNAMKGKGAGDWWRSLIPCLRAGLEKGGWWKLVMMWVGLSWAALPKDWLIKKLLPPLPTDWGISWADWRSQFLSSLGLLLALYFSVSFLKSVWGAGKILRKDFLGVNSHAEKLGLQATIGEDVKALLLGWAWKRSKGFRWRWLAYSVLAGSLLGALFCRTQPEFWWTYIWPCIFAVVALGIPISVFLLKPPTHLLLVVDDLDRCPFEHQVSVVESIKLLTEDPDVGSRLKIAYLIEEDVFTHALWAKYRHLEREEVQKKLGTKFTPRQIIRENFEKLFTATLRLRPLVQEDIENIVLHFGTSSNESEQPGEDAGKPPQPETESTKVGRKADGPVRPVPPPVNSMPQQSPIGKGDVHKKRAQVMDGELTDHERRMIAYSLTRSREADGMGLQVQLGPRAIRSFIFRYQLAKLLMKKLDIRITDKEYGSLVELLAKRLKETKAQPGPGWLNPRMLEVLDDVS